MLYIVIILFLIFSGVLAVVAFENFTTQVQVSLFAWQSPDLPLGLLLLLVFVLGAVLLYLVSAATALHDWGELRRLRLRVQELESLIQQHTTAPTLQEGQESAEGQGTPPGQIGQPGQPIQPPPIVPMPGMPTKPDISDMPTQH